MSPSDLQDIINLLSTDPQYSHFAKRIKKDYADSEAIFIKDENQQTIGFCLLYPFALKLNFWDQTFKEEGWVNNDFKFDPNSYELMYMYISSQYRGQGKGSELFKRAMELARLKKATTIYAYVSDKNPKVLSFYQKHDAEIIHDFADEDMEISTAYLMWKM